MPGKVQYERVNLAEIETSTDEDDYGDLFAKERRQGLGKSRPLRHKKKGGKCLNGGICCKSFCVVTTVLAILGLIAGAALYLDPEGTMLTISPGSNKSEDTANINTSPVSSKSNLSVSVSNTTQSGSGPSPVVTVANTTTKDKENIQQNVTETQSDSPGVISDTNGKNETNIGKKDDSEENRKSTWSSSMFTSLDRILRSSNSQLKVAGEV